MRHITQKEANMTQQAEQIKTTITLCQLAVRYGIASEIQTLLSPAEAETQRLVHNPTSATTRIIRK